MELDPFDWHEIHGAPASGDLLEALVKPELLPELTANFDKKQLLSLCLYGGYPEPVLKKDDRRFYRLWMESYLTTYIERDIRALFPQLNIDAYKLFYPDVGLFQWRSNQRVSVRPLAGCVADDGEELPYCAYGLVVNNGDAIYKLSDRVYQLPAIFL